LTIDEWESEFPLGDLALRECIRFTVPGTSFRKNASGHDIEIAGSKGEFIPNGAFAAYLLEDTHFDPKIYSDMYSYDPGRFLEDRAEDKKVAHGFLGWGAGRHPCRKFFCASDVLAVLPVFPVELPSPVAEARTLREPPYFYRSPDVNTDSVT